MTKRPTPAGGVNESIKRLVKFFERNFEGDHPGPEEAREIINELGAIVSSGHAKEAGDSLSLVLEMRPKRVVDQPLPATGVNMQALDRKWKTHRNKHNLATHYTLTLKGMRLRVERTEENGLVWFIGYVDDERLVREKHRANARLKTASFALQKAAQK